MGFNLAFKVLLRLEFFSTEFWKTLKLSKLTLILLTWTIWWTHNNASKWQMGFNLAFKVLIANDKEESPRGLIRGESTILEFFFRVWEPNEKSESRNAGLKFEIRNYRIRSRVSTNTVAACRLAKHIASRFCDIRHDKEAPQNHKNNWRLVVCFLLGNSPASEFYMPTFRNILSVPSS
jgi:hypothetical protein